MPRNSGTEDFDNRELTRTLLEDGLSTSLPMLTGNQVRLAPRSLIHVVMPPLTLYIWQQLDYLRQKGSRLAGKVTDHVGVGLTSPRIAHLPILLPTLIPTLGKPLTHSPMWWRLLHLIWLRQRQKRNPESLQRLLVADEGQLVNDIDKSTGADELYLSELLQSVHILEEKQIVTAIDELYSIVNKNLHLPVLGTTELPDTTDDLFSQTLAPFVHLQTKQLAQDLKAKDAGQSAAPHISSNKILSIYQTNQIQKSNLMYIKHVEDTLGQANWQPWPTYQSRWLDKVRAPLTRGVHVYRESMEKALHIALDNISATYTILLPHLSYLAAVRGRAEPGSQAAELPFLPYIASTPEVTDLGQVTSPTVESYNRLPDLEPGGSLLYSSPNQSEPSGLRIVVKRLGQFTTLKTKNSFKELQLKSLRLKNKEPASSLLATGATLPQAPEISQPRWSVPLVNSSPQIAGQRTEATNVSEDSGNMNYSPVIVTEATTDNASLGQGWQAVQTEMPLTSRGPLSVASLHRQSSPTGIYQMPTSPLQQYFKPVGRASPPDRSEGFSFPWKQEYEPSALGYKDTHQPALESLFTSIVEPRTGSKATSSGGALSAAFQGTAYYGSQTMPELALAPVGRQVEEVSPPSPKAEAKTEETVEEAPAPDIDTIARDVYSILKRRLARERERAQGLS